MMPRHRLQTGPDANVLGQVATLALSYLMLTGVSANYHQVLTLVRQRGLQFAGVTNINAISPADLAGVVAHVQAGLGVDTSNPGAQLHLARFQPGGLGLGTPFDGANLHPLVLALLRGDFGRLDGERDGLSRSVAYERAGMGSTSGNVSPAEFMTSPHTAMLRGMGMSGDTYAHLHGLGFSLAHIQQAARDARRLDFNVNDPRRMEDFSIINQRGNNPRRTMDRLEAFQRELRGSEAFRDAVRRRQAAAEGSEEWRRAQADIDRIVAQLSGSTGLSQDMQEQRDRAVAEAIGRLRRDIVTRERETIVGDLRLGPPGQQPQARTGPPDPPAPGPPRAPGDPPPTPVRTRVEPQASREQRAADLGM
jgi:hypothetical protein